MLYQLHVHVHVHANMYIYIQVHVHGNVIPLCIYCTRHSGKPANCICIPQIPNHDVTVTRAFLNSQQPEASSPIVLLLLSMMSDSQKLAEHYQTWTKSLLHRLSHKHLASIEYAYGPLFLDGLAAWVRERWELKASVDVYAHTQAQRQRM